jgi:hypothetical protein
MEKFNQDSLFEGLENVDSSVSIFSIGDNGIAVPVGNPGRNFEEINSDEEDDSLIDDALPKKITNVVPSSKQAIDDMSDEEEEDDDDDEDNNDNNDSDDSDAENSKRSTSKQKGYEEDNSDSEEDSEENENLTFILAKSYIKDGLLPEEYKDKKNITPTELKEALIESAQKSFEKDKLNEYLEQQGFTKEYLDYVKFLRHGGSAEGFNELQTLENIEHVEISGNNEEAIENRMNLIMAMYRDKNVTDKRAKVLYDSLVESGEDEEEAEVAKNYFSQKRIQILQKQEQEYLLQEKEKQEKLKSYKQNLDTIIEENNFFLAPLSKKDQESLKDYINKPTEIIVQRDNTGKERKYKVTKYQKDMMDFNKDPKKQLIFTELLRRNFNVTSVKNKIKEEVDDELSKAFGMKKVKSAKKSQDALFEGLSIFDAKKY